MDKERGSSAVTLYESELDLIPHEEKRLVYLVGIGRICEYLKRSIVESNGIIPIAEENQS